MREDNVVVSVAIVGFAISLTFVGICIFGWVANIVKLVNHIGIIDNLELARMAGVVLAPLGALLGYM